MSEKNIVIIGAGNLGIKAALEKAVAAGHALQDCTLAYEKLSLAALENRRPLEDIAITLNEMKQLQYYPVKGSRYHK